MMGHVEKDAYMNRWLFCRCCRVEDFADKHPRIPFANKGRALGCLICSYLRMYVIFVLPLNICPCLLWPGFLIRHVEMFFGYFTLLQLIPTVTDSLKLEVP